MTEWISVKDRLPGKNGSYICCVDNDGFRYVTITQFALDLEEVDSYYFKDLHYCGWYDFDNEYGYFERSGITHWMNKPELPNEE